MNYQNLITTLTEIYNNENIEKKGLTLVYELSPKEHKGMTEELFYKTNPSSTNCVYTDEFEVEIEGIVIRFIKKTNK